MADSLDQLHNPGAQLVPPAQKLDLRAHLWTNDVQTFHNNKTYIKAYNKPKKLKRSEI